MPSKLTQGQKALLRFSLHNSGPEAVNVLVWATPLEPRPWMGPYVKVTHNGQALRYRGATVKRGDPEAAAYLQLDAGQTRLAEVDLALAFDLSQAGRYHLTPQLVIHDLAPIAEAPPRPRERHVRVPLDCNSLDFDLQR
ncbi:hypothetical protein PRZ03_12085 [Paucibacter sp. hw8]|uniref:Uncharacterized protein n=1 Tax=Roseateles albus TaxID=2987525 RepID=A0ABT5KEI2_9BURK|nr:hypothetical protein [Roseateles albus]